MQHMRGMDVLQPTQDLINEILYVIIGKWLRRGDNLMEVGVHELGDNVYIVKLGFARRFENILN